MFVIARTLRGRLKCCLGSALCLDSIFFLLVCCVAYDVLLFFWRLCSVCAGFYVVVFQLGLLGLGGCPSLIKVLQFKKNVCYCQSMAFEH